MNNHTHKKVYIATQQGAHGNNKGAILLLRRDNAESFLGKGSQGSCVVGNSLIVKVFAVTVADVALKGKRGEGRGVEQNKGSRKGKGLT